MTTVHSAFNPFALMMDPEAVFAAVARSERLSQLASRICRPLDKPLVGHVEAAEAVEEEVGADESDPAVGDESGTDGRYDA